MADYYSQFSESVFAKLNADERQWIEETLSLDAQEELDQEQIEKRMPGSDLDYDWPGFDWSFEDDSLWVRSRESFCAGNLAAFLRAVLRKFRPEEVVTFTWAGTCSKLRAGEFGGGWCAVSARKVVFGDTWDAATTAAERMKRRAKS